MSRLHVLLFAGFAALPTACVTVPQSAPTAENQRPAATVTELPPEQAASVCLATAQALEKEGHEAEALLEYRRARENNPHLPGVARRLAVLYDRQGDVEHAQAEYESALREQPRDADCLNDYGYFHYQLGHNVDAETWLRKALAVDPAHQRAWMNLGKALARQGRYDESCAAFGHVVRPAQAAANVGILLAKDGKKAEAQQILNKALALEPDLKAARVVLTQLEATPTPDARLLVD